MMIKAFLFLLLPALAAQASWREGNGGDALKYQNNWYLLDLLEAGTQDRVEVPSPFVNTFITQEIHKWATASLVAVPETLIASKLQQIYDKNKVLALAVLATMTSLDWKWLELPLRELDDEGNSVLDLSQFEKQQLALRVGNNVSIQAGLWSHLNLQNQTALLFHEAIYSMIKARRDERGIDSNSPRVRRLVGFLFSSDLSTRPINEVLMTEALDVLIYPSGFNAEDLPRWSADHQSILFGRRWTAEVSVQNFPSAALGLTAGEAENPARQHDWIQTSCRRAAQAHSEIQLGLTADQVEMQLAPENKDPEQKDFYYCPLIKKSQAINSVTIAKSPRLKNCVSRMQEAMNFISQNL